MEAIQAIKNRHSTRSFDGKPVPRKDIETIVDAGRVAPSSRAVNPWEFVAVTDKEMLARLGKICDTGPFLKDAGAALIVICRDTKYYLEDGCAATENMLIAATALGISSCWVAGDKKPYAREVLDAVKAPSGFKLVSTLALGYALGESKQGEKRKLEEVLHWEKF